MGELSGLALLLSAEFSAKTDGCSKPCYQLDLLRRCGYHGAATTSITLICTADEDGICCFKW